MEDLGGEGRKGLTMYSVGGTKEMLPIWLKDLNFVDVKVFNPHIIVLNSLFFNTFYPTDVFWELFLIKRKKFEPIEGLSSHIFGNFF